jgi:endoglucanase
VLGGAGAGALAPDGRGAAQACRSSDRPGRRHGVHINLNLHRAPGHCVNPPREPLDLWTDAAALDASAAHWAVFAKRYQGVPNRELSFDLLNEPPDIPAASYVRVMKHLVAAIRAEDPQRLIIADGLRWGRDPVEGLAGLGLAQSTRGYDPMRVSHHQANWVKGSDQWAEPTWPLKEGGMEWNKDRLCRERIAPWRALEQRGVGVHVGEWGAHNRTPHHVALAWMRVDARPVGSVERSRLGLGVVELARQFRRAGQRPP